MKRFFLLIILLFLISFLYSDIARSDSFLGVAKNSDLVAKVMIRTPFEHGYLCEVEEIIFSKSDIPITKLIMIWCENDFEFGGKNLIAYSLDELLVALSYIKSDTKYENEYAVFIEKKGTYFLPDDSSYLVYKYGKVKGSLFKPFGWIENKKGKPKFVPYKETEMDYEKYKSILKEKLGQKNYPNIENKKNEKDSSQKKQ